MRDVLASARPGTYVTHKMLLDEFLCNRLEVSFTHAFQAVAGVFFNELSILRFGRAREGVLLDVRREVP